MLQIIYHLILRLRCLCAASALSRAYICYFTLVAYANVTERSSAFISRYASDIYA